MAIKKDISKLARNNCQKLVATFEGQEAIYIEGGVMRVRVMNIHYDIEARIISADIEEIPTKGLEDNLFSRYDRPRPIRCNIGAGFLTAFSAHAWFAGYGGWSLFFKKDIINEFIDFSAQYSDSLIAHYQQTLTLVFEHNGYESSERVFSD